MKEKYYLLISIQTTAYILVFILLTGCPKMPEEFTPIVVPMLNSPTDGATDIPVTTTLMWQQDVGANSYGLQVSLVSSFSSYIYNLSGLTTTNKQITGLTNATTYYWRVNTTNNLSTSGWSLVRSFITVASDALPTDGLVAYYPFNGNANDESGNGYDGTVYGATLTSDRFGESDRAYNFTGNSDYINTNFTPNFIFSISIWYYKNKNQNDNAGLLSTYSGGFNYSGIYYAMNGTTDWVRCDGNSLNAFNTSSSIWKNIVIVSDGVRVRVYENTIKKLDFAGKTSHSNKLIIGDSRYNGRYFMGKIDDIRVYNRALSENEIEALYNEEVNNVK